MGFPTVQFSGPVSGSFGAFSNAGTLTVQVTGNDDGTVSGTWSLTGTYTSPYGFGNEVASGTLSGTGGATGPWTITFAGGNLVGGPVTLAYSNGEYDLAVSAGYGVDIQYSGGYGDIFTYHADFNFAAQLAAAGPAPVSTTPTGGPDMLVGTPGDDTIAGGGGNDTIDGAAGIDTASFSDVRANYTITNQGGGHFTVAHLGGSGPDGTDTLVNVERLHFADAQVAIDIDGHGGEAFRLYQAAFNRVPDLPGLGFQMHALDEGWSLQNIAGDFLNSPEFQATYGNVSDTQFIELLYLNVLHRQGEDAGVQFHLNELASGQTRADVLVHFSESPENQANVIGQIQDGMLYVPVA
jgi:hypothetical protein